MQTNRSTPNQDSLSKTNLETRWKTTNKTTRHKFELLNNGNDTFNVHRNQNESSIDEKETYLLNQTVQMFVNQLKTNKNLPIGKTSQDDW